MAIIKKVSSEMLSRFIPLAITITIKTSFMFVKSLAERSNSATYIRITALFTGQKISNSRRVTKKLINVKSIPIFRPLKGIEARNKLTNLAHKFAARVHTSSFQSLIRFRNPVSN